ncbi:MAG: cyanophycin synthetase [Candidatus Uhrbacteria bacterium]
MPFPKSVYCIGVKGAGLSSLAQLLHARGVRVSGSDTDTHYFTQETLDAQGIPYVEGFAAGQIPDDVELVIRSTAYGEDHVEVADALRRGLRVVTYPEAIAMVFNSGKGIAVCGTHGKTTTTAMLGHILITCEQDPTVIVGSVVPQFGGSARSGKSDVIVIEADEYQNKLALYDPFGVVLLNIEFDHPDFFSDIDAYVRVFREFVARIPEDGFLIARGDDARVREVAQLARCSVVWFATEDAKRLDAGLRVPGLHNRLNALAAIAAAEQLGVRHADSERALVTFDGTKRRFECVGEVGGVTIIDDYAHHPTEIRAAVQAARERYPDRRLVVAFQPHTYTRTIALKEQFAAAFEVDRVFVMDIFGSAREQHGGITPQELAGAIEQHQTHASASGGVEETVVALKTEVRSGDVVLCLGAGENDRVAQQLLATLSHTT